MEKEEESIVKMTQPLTPENISRLHASLSPEAQSDINKMSEMIVDEYAAKFRAMFPEEKNPKFGREQARELIYVLVSRGLI